LGSSFEKLKKLPKILVLTKFGLRYVHFWATVSPADLVTLIGRAAKFRPIVCCSRQRHSKSTHFPGLQIKTDGYNHSYKKPNQPAKQFGVKRSFEDDLLGVNTSSFNVLDLVSNPHPLFKKFKNYK
jgi:hypothetical protein